MLSPAGEFVGLGFVASPWNADAAAIRASGLVTGLAVQTVSGTGPSEQPAAIDALLEACRVFGLERTAWAWCAATDVAGAELEARYHARDVAARRLPRFIANAEESYDAHGDSRSPRYGMLGAYVRAFEAELGTLGYALAAKGITSTPTFASDMTEAQARGWIGMPQAFPLAAGPTATIEAAVAHWRAWGWTIETLRPLAQTYRTDGAYPDATGMLVDAAELEVGLIPYTVEQAMSDPEGRRLLETLRPAIMRLPKGEGANIMETIGKQNGVNAAVDRMIARERELAALGAQLAELVAGLESAELVDAAGARIAMPTIVVRDVDDDGTNPNRNPANLSTWGAYDKLRRTLLILVDAHDSGG